MDLFFAGFCATLSAATAVQTAYLDHGSEAALAALDALPCVIVERPLPVEDVEPVTIIRGEVLIVRGRLDGAEIFSWAPMDSRIADQLLNGVGRSA